MGWAKKDRGKTRYLRGIHLANFSESSPVASIAVSCRGMVVFWAAEATYRSMTSPRHYLKKQFVCGPFQAQDWFFLPQLFDLACVHIRLGVFASM